MAAKALTIDGSPPLTATGIASTIKAEARGARQGRSQLSGESSEGGGDAVAQKPAEASKAIETSGKTSRAEAAKSWFETLASALKAAIFAIPVVVAGLLIALSVARDDESHTIRFTVDPETRTNLNAIGVDVDIPSIFVGTVNDRVVSLQQIAAVNRLKSYGEADDGAGVSLKPFKIEASTQDIRQIWRYLVNAPPENEVGVVFSCAPEACSAAARSQGTLTITLAGGWGRRRTSNSIPLASNTLRRNLRRVLQENADLLLERMEPLAAADYYLNASAFTRAFWDEQRQSLARAEADALAARRKGNRYCLSEIIAYDSLGYRGLLREFGDYMKPLTELTNDKDEPCKKRALINLVIIFFWDVACNNGVETRQALTKAIVQLADIERREKNDPMADHMRQSIVYGEVIEFLKASSAARLQFCAGTRTYGAEGDDDAAAQSIETIAENFVSRLATAELAADATNASLSNRNHGQFNLLRGLIEDTSMTAKKRSALLRDLRQAIDKYASYDEHPRRLFIEQAELALDSAVATVQGGDPSDSLSDQLRRFEIAAENAAATDTFGPPLEANSTLETFTLLGDAKFAMGEFADARGQYASAVDAFVNNDAPVDEIFDLARALGHWATVEAALGACDAKTSGEGADMWALRTIGLGARGLDLCSLARRLSPADPPGIPGIVKSLLDDTTDCVPKSPMSANFAQPYGNSPEALQERLEVVKCLRASGVDKRAVRNAFLRRNSGASTDVLIERALANARP